MARVPPVPAVETVEIVELARAGVTRIAPEELPLFDSVSDAWLAGRLPGRDGRRRPPGGTVRIGVPAELDIALVYDVITGALAGVLGEAAYASLKGRRRWWSRRGKRPQTHVSIDPESRAALHTACMVRAQTLGMSRKKAMLLADSLFGPRTDDGA